ncbi:MAG: hypothetical protein Q7S42_03525 [Candidatus Omnitrophota bacterium]|nr:hypothetical protein [Candidatus Omnitrophota bacterium]
MAMDNVQSVLTILLAIELFVITACIAVVSYFLIKTLKSISHTAESFGKIKALIPIPALLIAILSKIFKKRG